jgi:hypothetical protein
MSLETCVRWADLTTAAAPRIRSGHRWLWFDARVLILQPEDGSFTVSILLRGHLYGPVLTLIPATSTLHADDALQSTIARFPAIILSGTHETVLAVRDSDTLPSEPSRQMSWAGEASRSTLLPRPAAAVELPPS